MIATEALPGMVAAMIAARTDHTCHAIGCHCRTRPEMLMCRRHWFMVPRALRTRVWATYRRGQCDDRKPSRAWLLAARAAIEAVAAQESEASKQLSLTGTEALRP